MGCYTKGLVGKMKPSISRVRKDLFFDDPPRYLPTTDGLVQDLTLTSPLYGAYIVK